MTRIYTRSGDAGETGLFNGQRIKKTDPIFQAIGDVDELNSWLGVIRGSDVDLKLDDGLQKIQNKLFDLGSNLAGFNQQLISDKDIKQLEVWIDEMDESLQPLKMFILPAGGQVSSFVHLARSVCRRAERSVVISSDSHSFASNCQIYLNRLSDFLFVLARLLSRGNEQYWQADDSASD